MESELLAGRYRIKHRLGTGGMCEVFLVEDVRLSSLWAMKRQLPLETRTSTESLEEEAALMSSLSHPCIPTIADFFVKDEIEHLVMEYCIGENLESVLEHSPLPAELALEMGIKLADAVNYLHTREKPIIFRDIKPSNIMVSRSGSVRLIDFGIARLHSEEKSGDTQALGTPGYAAPEQYGRGQSDPRTDVFGLGATLHHALTGLNPTQNPFTFPPVSRHCPDLPLAVERLLDKAVALKPEDRFQSMGEFLEELEAVRKHRDMKLALESNQDLGLSSASMSSEEMMLRVQLEEQELALKDFQKEREDLRESVKFLEEELTKEREQTRKALARASVEDKQVQLEVQKLQALVETKERERALEAQERVSLEKSLSETNAKGRQMEVDLLRYEEAFRRAADQTKRAISERDRLIQELQGTVKELETEYRSALARETASANCFADLSQSAPQVSEIAAKLLVRETELAETRLRLERLEQEHRSTLAQLEARRLEILAIAEAVKKGDLKELEHFLLDADTGSLDKVSESARLKELEALLARSCELWMRAEAKLAHTRN